MTEAEERVAMLTRTAEEAREVVFCMLAEVAIANFGHDRSDCSGVIQGGLLAVMEYALQSDQDPMVLEYKLRAMFDLLLPQAVMRRHQRDLGSATEAGHA